MKRLRRGRRFSSLFILLAGVCLASISCLVILLSQASAVFTHTPPSERKHTHSPKSGAAIAKGLTGALNLDSTATAEGLAAAMDIEPSAIVSATLGASDPQGGFVFTSPLSKFPTSGDSFAAISTGRAADAALTNNEPDLSTELEGLKNSEGNDLFQLTLTLRVPPGKTYWAVDWKFLSEEFQEFVGSEFNDAFFIETPTSNIIISGNIPSSPTNVAFDSGGERVSVNTTGVKGMNPKKADGTTYDGGTSIVSTFARIPSGATEITIIFSITDLGDSVFDTTVFLDNFRFLDKSPVPTNLRATPGNRMVDLQWEPTGFESPRGWNVYFREEGTQDWNRIPNTSAVIPPDPDLPTVSLIPFPFVSSTPFQSAYRAVGDFINSIQNGVSYEFSITEIGATGEESTMSLTVRAHARTGNPGNIKPQNPILFLHGIAVDAASWDKTKDSFTQTWGWGFGGDLEIDPSCPESNPCARFKNGNGLARDFYTATFSEKNANNGDGIRQQGREVKAFLQELHILFPPKQKFIIVAHSMGGLAARAYLEGLSSPPYAYDVSHFISYGTPHDGTPLRILIESGGPFLRGLLAIGELFNKVLSALDVNGQGARQMESGNEFLATINFLHDLPDTVAYAAITGSFGPCDNKILRDLFQDRSDCIVSESSQDLSQLATHLGIDGRSITVINGNRSHISETDDYTRITEALTIMRALIPASDLKILTHSPVDVEITDPNGFRIGKFINEIPGASYEEFDIDGDNEPNDEIVIPFALSGDYLIRVIPDSGAGPAETYTLEVVSNGITRVLAQDQPIKDIPAIPFIARVSIPGDLDGDGDVDQNDLNIILADRNKGVALSACGARCDLDGDGRITALDARRLTTLCTRPRCAIR